MMVRTEGGRAEAWNQASDSGGGTSSTRGLPCHLVTTGVQAAAPSSLGMWMGVLGEKEALPFKGSKVLSSSLPLDKVGLC